MITSEQVRGARGLVGWSQRELAEKAGVSSQTVMRMETRGTAFSSAGNLAAVEAVLIKAGVDFIPENGGGAGVRLRKPLSKRKRERL